MGIKVTGFAFLKAIYNQLELESKLFGPEPSSVFDVGIRIPVWVEV